MHIVSQRMFAGALERLRDRAASDGDIVTLLDASAAIAEMYNCYDETFIPTALLEGWLRSGDEKSLKSLFSAVTTRAVSNDLRARA